MKTHYETMMGTYTAALAILFDHVSKYGELKVSMVTLYSVVKHNMPINGENVTTSKKFDITHQK